VKERKRNMSIRRVVTGHDKNGNAVFASDGQVQPVTTPLIVGAEWSVIWGGDGPPTFPDDGQFQGFENYFPAPGGYRLYIVTMPAGYDGSTAEGIDVEAAIADLNKKLPGMIGHSEPDHPGMHTSATIDFEVMLAGEIVLELDNGSERIARAGDVIVQNGTRHRWLNRSNEPAKFAAFIVGAHRAKA
jgi:hypothetical protein